MLRVVNEIRLCEFDAWAGGKDTLEILKKIDGAIDIVESYLLELEEITNGCNLSELDINDFLWHERDFIFHELLGLTEKEVDKLFGYKV